MIISFDECKSVVENNDIILKKIDILDLTSLNEQEIVGLANILFKLFKANFENNNYSKMEEISKYCKLVVGNCVNKKIYTETFCAETIIDIACFVFEQMYMYEEKVSILKMIIESENVEKALRVRALDEILSPEPEIRKLIAKNVKKFSSMLKNLSS